MREREIPADAIDGEPGDGTALVAARGLTKAFGATRALDAVDVTIARGEVHALVGENGAGKSTLIKILSGVYRADAGSVLLDGRAFRPLSPADAQQAGIVLIPQELRVVPAMTVAENVLLGVWPTARLGGALAPVSTRRMRERTRTLLAELGLDIDPRRRADTLPFAERQLVVIARALNHRATCLILDEPTASLESREVERLFSLIDRLKAGGTAIVYVSHRLEEIHRLAERTTVLRDGRVVARYRRGTFTTDDLIRDMTGRSLEVLDRPHAADRGAVVLEAALPGGDAQAHPVRLSERTVTGVAGLLGSGATEAMLSLYGARGRQACQAGGEDVTVKSPRDAIDRHIGFVPSERSLGIVPSLAVWENIALPHLDRLRRARGLSWRAIRALASEVARQLDIRPADPTLRAGSLSGGNQQKVLFARWLVERMTVLLLDEPTHGIDIGAKARIDLLIRQFAEEGGAVMMTSSEFHELLKLSDEVLTMRHGRITRRVERGEPDYAEMTLRNELGG
ncbi:MAG: sugar ABC transporter ATP-binding protein [Azospirillaceae bacterium]